MDGDRVKDIGSYSPNTIVQGHVLDVLKRLPDESIHCCVTSPPYWGLRSYSTQPQVWGGGSECQHVWGEQHIRTTTPHKGLSDAADRGAPRGNPRGDNRYEDGQTHGSASQGQFCQLCGAWRGELGLEPSPEQFVSHLVEIFREVRRVLRNDGTLWLNLGASYAGSGRGPTGKSGIGNQQKRQGFVDPGAWSNEQFKPKDLIPIPWMVAMTLQQDGYWLRSSIIWAKGVSFCPTYSGSCMPESVRDRPTQSYEYVFLLTKSKRYYYDAEAVKEPLACPDVADGTRVFGGVNKHGVNVDHGERITGRVYDSAPSGRNLRSVWTINPQPFPGAHFATFPPKLIEPMILAGTSEKGVCAECGSPWKRVVKKSAIKDGPTVSNDRKDLHGPTYSRHKQSIPGGQSLVGYSSSTVGWQPTCSCGRDDTEPAIVLDPFMGSGTTAIVALEHNRNFLGIELNPEYVAMAEKRIAEVQPRLL